VALGEALPALPFPAEDGTYALAHADGDLEGAGGAVLVEPFEADDDRLAASWEALRALLAARQGYLGARLYRSEGPARYPVVGLVRWSSPLMYARALAQDDVAAARAALPVPGHPALYLRV